MLEPSVVAAALLAFAEEEFEYRSFSGYVNDMRDVTGTKFNVPELGEITIVAYHDYDVHKSYNGWSEKLWIVFEVQGVLYRAEGTHTSWTGSEWLDTVQIVVPKNRTVVEYKESNGHEYLI